MAERLVTFKISKEMLYEVDQRRIVLGMTRTDYIKALFLLDIAKHILDDTSNIQNFQQEVQLKLDLLLSSVTSLHDRLSNFNSGENTAKEHVGERSVPAEQEVISESVAEKSRSSTTEGKKSDTGIPVVSSLSSYISSLTKAQVRPYSQILNLIYSKGGMSRRELARTLSRRAAKLTPILSRLQQDGIIRIEEIPNSNGDVLLIPCLT